MNRSTDCRFRWGFLPALLGVVFLFLPASAAGEDQVMLTGTQTLPLSPTALRVGDAFACLPGGFGKLTYPDGSYISLFAGTEGSIQIQGISLKIGRTRVSLRKRGKGFVIKTPLASLGIRGTEFRLEVSPASIRVGLMEGAVEVQPLDRRLPRTLLEAGRWFELFADGRSRFGKYGAKDGSPGKGQPPEPAWSLPTDEPYRSGESGESGEPGEPGEPGDPAGTPDPSAPPGAMPGSGPSSLETGTMGDTLGN